MFQTISPNTQVRQSHTNQNEYLSGVLNKIDSIKNNHVELPENITYKGIFMEVVNIDYNFENICQEEDLSFFLEQGHLVENSYRTYQDRTIGLPTTPKTIYCEYIDNNKTIREYHMSYERYLKHGKNPVTTPQLLHED